MSNAESMSRREIVQWIGMFAGPALALLCYFLLPEEYESADGASVLFSTAGRATIGAMVWMGTWWLTEAIEISATALWPIALFPVVGIASIADTTAPYASPLIFLFLGGFLLALSMQRWGLDRRIALLTLKLVGTKPINMIGGFMVATAVLSAFVSNTATTAMMLPIGLSVIALVNKQGNTQNAQDDASHNNFATCLMLCIAYAASIGGIATIIGTPPNVFLVDFIRDKIDSEFQMEINFVSWMIIGVPLTAIFLPVCWLLLTRVVYPVRIKHIEGGRDLINAEYKKLGPMKRGEWVTFIVFVITALLWIIRPILSDGIAVERDEITGEIIDAWLVPFLPGLRDGGIAMLGGLVLFLIPAGTDKREFVMNWATARKLPWGILMLFGGGLTLAAAVTANGVADYIGACANAMGGMPTLFFVILVITCMIFLTELTSNTATTATLVPILAAVAIGLGMHPYLLIVPAAIAASCAFMMPVATPPNAIVFGSGYITIPQMCKAGLWLNIIGIVLVTVLAYTVLGWVFQLSY